MSATGSRPAHLSIQGQERNVVVERFGGLFLLSVSSAPVIVGILGAPPGVDLDVDHGVVGGLGLVVTACIRELFSGISVFAN